MNIDWTKFIGAVLIAAVSAAGGDRFVHHQVDPRDDAYASMAKVLMDDLEACREGN